MEPSAQTSVRVLAVGHRPVEPGPGFELELAADVADALARVTDGGIDVMLLSVDGPDGVEALEAVRAGAPDTPLVAVVGDEGRGLETIRRGAHDYVVAGATPDVVRHSIRYATVLHRMEGELRRRQVTDELTGLYNARGFEHLARHHLGLSDRSKTPVVLVFFRLEDLGRVSEASGSGEADRLLVETAGVLRDAVRGSDVIARVGDDVFCALLAGNAKGAEALVLARLVEAVAARNARSDRPHALEISVGAVEYDPEHPASLDELIAQADRRMRARPDHVSER